MCVCVCVCEQPFRVAWHVLQACIIDLITAGPDLPPGFPSTMVLLPPLFSSFLLLRRDTADVGTGVSGSQLFGDTPLGCLGRVRLV